MIADWSELIAEVVTRTGDGSIATRAEMLTGFAENDLNRRLRVGQMEIEDVIFTDDLGAGQLPDDFLQMRRLMNGQNVLTGCTFSDLQSRPLGFSIIGNMVKTHVPNGELPVAYYAKLPPLATCGTNWLLQQAPELYLAALQRQAYVAKLDVEKAQLADGVVMALVNDLQQNDFAARYVGTAYTVEGPTP